MKYISVEDFMSQPKEIQRLENDLIKAINIALVAHSGQKDKGNNPYILHPLAVMNRVEGMKEKTIAVLHDIIEDTYITENDLRKLGFSEEIIETVLLLSKLDKKEDYIHYIKRVKKNELARKIKLADLKENMNLKRIPNPTEKDYKRVIRYKKAYDLLLKEEDL